MEKFVTTSKAQDFSMSQIKEMVEERNSLIDHEGQVYSWEAETKERPSCRLFRTVDDTKKYWELKFHLKNRFAISYSETPISYIIGTEKDYKKAVANFAANKSRMEVKKYAENIGKNVDRIEREIKALEGLKVVCRNFDGKILNCHFHAAIKKQTGFRSCFGDGLKLEYSNYLDKAKETTIKIYNYYDSDHKEKAWPFGTCDRMEADKALAIIDLHINDRKLQIPALQATVKRYAAYVKKVRKLEAEIRELADEDANIRAWAMNHDLQRPFVSNIWQ